MGKNRLKSLQKGSLFPLQLRAWGLNLGDRDPVEMEIDLTLNLSKGYLLNGASGCLPCCGGVGTLYYSAPNLALDPSRSTLWLKGEEISLAWGKFWYDHQWCTGFMPAGNPGCPVMRAANNLSAVSPAGWDWFPVQFDDNREMAIFAMHFHEGARFYGQTGPNPPGDMAVRVRGKYVDGCRGGQGHSGIIEGDKVG